MARIEGYWYSSHTPQFPKPVPNDQPWAGQAEFLKALSKKETGSYHHISKGFSLCRVCERINGSVEYESGEWSWPSGLRHYVEDHNVKPSDDFIAWVMK
jgi:hypothetical protein